MCKTKTKSDIRKNNEHSFLLNELVLYKQAIQDHIVELNELIKNISDCPSFAFYSSSIISLVLFASKKIYHWHSDGNQITDEVYLYRT